MNKKFVIVSAVLMYFIAGYFAFDYFNTSGPAGISFMGGVKNQGSVSMKPVQVNPEEFEGPKNQECPLNGKMLTDGHKKLWESRRPLGVMIENHEEARPQSGLTSADVVYEFVAEGGITRFLAMFYCEDAPYIGPVRSARMYFLSELRGYGESPLYAHVGGANTPGPADALGTINKIGWGGYNDMNQFSIAFPTYYRDYERNPGVATEHTMYSSTKKLWDFAATKRKLTNVDEDGKSWDEDFTPWKFKDGKAVAEPTAKISYDFWAGRGKYSVSWAYDKATNSYKRSHGDGVPHTDKNNKKQITVKNLVVNFMKESPANDGYPGGHLVYGTLGSGKSIIFQNGEAIEGTWKKAKDEDLIRFYDGSGNEMEFVRGQIWISNVPTGNTVEY